MAEVIISGVKRDVPFIDVSERVRQYVGAGIYVAGLIQPRPDQTNSSRYGRVDGRVSPDCQDISVSLTCERGRGCDPNGSGVPICGRVFMEKRGIEIPRIPDECTGCPRRPQT